MQTQEHPALIRGPTLMLCRETTSWRGPTCQQLPPPSQQRFMQLRTLYNIQHGNEMAGAKQPLSRC